MDANGTKIFMSSGRHHRWSFFFDSIMKARRQRQIRRAIKTGDAVRQRERARDCVPSVPAGYAAFGCIQSGCAGHCAESRLSLLAGSG